MNHDCITHYPNQKKKKRKFQKSTMKKYPHGKRNESILVESAS